MLTVNRSGSLSAAIREIRDVPARVIPYAASTALTRTARLGQTEIIGAMQREFDRPTRYTLNATRVVPSTIQTLMARVAVKDQAAGTAPEHYLLPEVEGGPRREKRFERALRFSGLLPRGMFAVPGAGAQLDESGNVPPAMIRRLLRELKAQDKAKGSGKRRRRTARSGELFAGQPKGRGNRPTGIWRREGRRLLPVLLFVRQPRYRSRLDFEGIVKRVAEAHFPDEFRKAAEAIAARRR